jgi:hypothetical protein
VDWRELGAEPSIRAKYGALGEGSAGGLLRDFGSRFSVLGSWFSVLGSWFSVLGSRFLVLSSRFLVLGSRLGRFRRGLKGNAKDGLLDEKIPIRGGRRHFLNSPLRSNRLGGEDPLPVIGDGGQASFSESPATGATQSQSSPPPRKTSPRPGKR